MRDLSLHVLDIGRNAVDANAENISIRIIDDQGRRTLVIEDDGDGMDPEFAAHVIDPFSTTRTVRDVGLGLPLLKLNAQLTGGDVKVRSEKGRGTTVEALFQTDHIDCIPLGDMAATMITLIQGSPEIEFSFEYRGLEDPVTLSTREIRAVLGDDIPIDLPEVTTWIRKTLQVPYN